MRAPTGRPDGCGADHRAASHPTGRRPAATAPVFRHALERASRLGISPADLDARPDCSRPRRHRRVTTLGTDARSPTSAESIGAASTDAQRAAVRREPSSAAGRWTESDADPCRVLAAARGPRRREPASSRPRARSRCASRPAVSQAHAVRRSRDVAACVITHDRRVGRRPPVIAEVAAWIDGRRRDRHALARARGSLVEDAPDARRPRDGRRTSHFTTP